MHSRGLKADDGNESALSLTGFLPSVPVEHVLDRFGAAGRNEVGSVKLESPESSAALAVNCFGWFISRPSRFPSLPGLDTNDPVEMVDLEEFTARFPWAGGRYSWLDAVNHARSVTSPNRRVQCPIDTPPLRLGTVNWT